MLTIATFCMTACSDSAVGQGEALPMIPQAPGEMIRDCSKDGYASIWEHAKLSGVDFRGVGNEPGWVLEIRNADSIHFEYDYGENEINESAPEPQEDALNRRARYVTESMEVTIEGVACQDTMADHSFESRVTVIVGDREFHGCGKALH